MARFLVTLLIDVADDSHPRKFIPDCINAALKDDEDLIDYNFMEYKGDELLVDVQSGTILNPNKCKIVPGTAFHPDIEYSDSEAIDIADSWGVPVVPEA
jgi:hypothetical protein